MSAIDQHICGLLYDHDCVIVPQLGGFLSSYQGATIHPVHHTISPPSRKVAFNVFLKQNDGLLANQLSGAERIGYQEAVRKIESYAIACQKELGEGKKVIIEGVGILYYDSEKNLQFDPAPAANFLRDSFGLAPIQYLPVKQDNKKPEKPLKELVTIRPSVKKEKVRTGSSKKILNRIVIGCAVLWLGVNAFLVYDCNKGVVAFFNPIQQKESIQATAPAVSPAPQSEAALQPPVKSESTAAIISVPETLSPVQHKTADATELKTTEPAQKNFSETEIQSPARSTIEKPSASVTQQIATTGEKYFVIAGAFRIPENASTLVAQLQSRGFSNAHIVQSSHKLTLVCYDTYATRHDANKALDSLRSGNQDGWVFSN
jgi:cell division septation protein DedD